MENTKPFKLVWLSIPRWTNGPNNFACTIVLLLLINLAGIVNCQNLTPAKLDGKMGYVDSTGKVVIPGKYSEARAFHDGLAAVLLHGLYGYIDKTGTEVIPRKWKYKYVGDFHDGLAWVCVSVPFLNPKERLFVYIDKKGKKITRHKYREVGDFHNGLASVRFRSGLSGTIDRTGKAINVN